jgi:hypothetical protein
LEERGTVRESLGIGFCHLKELKNARRKNGNDLLFLL